MAPVNERQQGNVLEQVVIRWLWRVPGYASLWQSGFRGWIPFPDGRASLHVARFRDFVRPGPSYRSNAIPRFKSEGDLKKFAIERICGTVAGNPTNPVHASLRASAQKAISVINLTNELDMLARLDQAVSRMRSELCTMLFVMPSFALFFYGTTRSSIQIGDIFHELNQHLFQCSGFKEDAQIVVPTLQVLSCIAEVCIFMSHGLFLEYLLKGISFRLRNVYLSDAHSVLTTSIIRRKSLGSGRLWSTLAMDYDAVAAKAFGDSRRDAFLAKAGLEPPPVLRMIDCTATCEGGQVVLVNWEDSTVKLASKGAYSAISHTFGGAVYEVFNCKCASICRAAKARACCTASCPHDPTASDAVNTTHYETVKDILKMCAILRASGVDYAWHDGVCIAQHDEDEVRATIKHIGWIYSSAKETIVFLHYIGTPMAPIRPGYKRDDMVSRWDTRVWTIQEAALSKRRRYCVRVGTMEMSDQDCKSPEDVVNMVGLWYDEKFSKVEVVEEERFFEILKSLGFILNSVLAQSASHGHPINAETMYMLLCWGQCVDNLLDTLQCICFSFPTLSTTLRYCNRRDSKHRGDRINSILTLAGVKGFVAAKDSNVEASTLEFFKRQGQMGLAMALFTTNLQSSDDPFRHAVKVRRYKWLPVLDSSFKYLDACVKGIRLTVLENGRLEVRPVEGHDLLCIRVRIVHKPPLELVSESTGYAEDQQMDCLPSVSLFRTSVNDGKLELGIRCCKQNRYLVFLTLPDDSLHCRLGELTTNLLVPRWSNGSEQVGTARIVSPSSVEGDERPLEEEESFDAYLVMSSEHVRDTPGLLLQGHDIRCGEVSRIGLFTPHDSFVRTLSHPLIRFVLHKLEKVIIN